MLKHASPADDWIVRATRDDDIREGWLAATATDSRAWIGQESNPPWDVYLGSGRRPVGRWRGDPDARRVDGAGGLGAPGSSTVLSVEATDRLLDRIAMLHAVPWSTVLTEAAARAGAASPPWCPARRTADPADAGSRPPDTRPRAIRSGRSSCAAGTGSSATRLRPPGIWSLGWPPTPLRSSRPWTACPSVGLHGDIKLANVALHPDGRVGFIDWQMTLEAPVAVELGWMVGHEQRGAAPPARGGLPSLPVESGLVRRTVGRGPAARTSRAWSATGTRRSTSR